MFRLIFPCKCVLCHRLLTKDQTDFCHHCRQNTETFKKSKHNIPFVAHWTALWYYKENVRKSIHRFKFGFRRHYAEIYARHLAIKLSDSLAADADILSWIPVSPLRKLKRGYDQSELLCRAIANELGMPATPVLKKIRNTPPQSGLKGIDQRRANILGAYKPMKSVNLSGKRILLIDDVVTTGATGSECAKTLLIAGAKEVYLAAIAAASHDNK